MNLKAVLGYSIIVGILVNLILPNVLMPFATEVEIKPPLGASSLSFKEQLMHMFVHHAQVPLTSSIIVAIIVAVSLLGGYLVDDKVNKIRK